MLEQYRPYIVMMNTRAAASIDAAERRYADALRRVSAYGAVAIGLLGGAPERPLVEFAEEDDDAVPRLPDRAESAEE